MKLGIWKPKNKDVVLYKKKVKRSCHGNRVGRKVSCRYKFWLNCRITCHCFAWRWIRTVSIVFWLVLKRTQQTIVVGYSAVTPKIFATEKLNTMQNGLSSLWNEYTIWPIMVHLFHSFLREIKIITCVFCISTPAVNILFYLIFLWTAWNLSVVQLAVTVWEPVRISRYSFYIKSNNTPVTQWWISWSAILRGTPLNSKEQCELACHSNSETKCWTTTYFFVFFRNMAKQWGS